MSQRSVPAPFLTKTYHLVDDRSSDDVISWNESGTTFVVWKTAEFAKDLLPNYFKHNNFSSFVRQLNTYGFRKIVPDKWEFANENFKRDQKELLIEIRRRKTVPSQNPAGEKNVAADSRALPENSGDDLGSSSTSSPDSKNPGSLETQTSAQLADLSDENEKLKKNNHMLSSELAQTKKQCDELIAFLTQCVKVAPEQINRIMNGSAPIIDEAGPCSRGMSDGNTDIDDDENVECLKLFGVMVKKKRGRDENPDFSEVHKKEMKRTVEVDAPWMKISASSGENSKVYN
ncbi:heat shock factor protein HSF24-like [Olea europaea var. sylvestris]|uniref:heat shock factor protein HSF24-like n=1 Tax=Olea europaea var. sylvestris TaxID=158386 RepID=UPI000C1D53D9|nr:heat shock factor protein HSF24-like [Olea europaea var. sylvestris]